MTYNNYTETLKIQEYTGFLHGGKSFFRTYLSIFLFISYSMINFTGCCMYSFTGASVPEHLKTIAIPIADDRSGTGEPNLRELLTNELTQRFIDDNTLRVGQRVNANALLEATITSLVGAPAIVTAGELVATWRLTLTVQVVYRDLVQKKTIYEKSFSSFGEYEPNDINQRETALQQAVERISDDILLETVSGW